MNGGKGGGTMHQQGAAAFKGETRMRTNFPNDFTMPVRSPGSLSEEAGGCQRQVVSLRGSNGFTLVEMLVVISILAILASLLMPGLTRSLESARTLHCTNNLKQMWYAANLYEQEYGGLTPSWLKVGASYDGWIFGMGPYLGVSFPSAHWPPSVLKPYILNSVFSCPTFTFDFTRSSYCYGMNWQIMPDHTYRWQVYCLPIRLNAVARPSKTRYLCDTASTDANYNASHIMSGGPNDSWGTPDIRHSGGNSMNLLFLDGHVEPVNAITYYSKSVWY